MGRTAFSRAKPRTTCVDSASSRTRARVATSLVGRLHNWRCSVLWCRQLLMQLIESKLSRTSMGARPASAIELRQWLKSTPSEEETRRISVVVVDVTPPE